MQQPTLHLLMGLPGSGKSTFAQLLQELTNAVRLSSDEYRLMLFAKPTFNQTEHDTLYSLLDHTVDHLLQDGYDVIYDANLNRLQHREEKYELARRHNARVILWWLDVPKTLAKKRRLQSQDARLIPNGEDPDRMFERVSSVIEVPHNDEPVVKVLGEGLTHDSVATLLSEYSQ